MAQTTLKQLLFENHLFLTFNPKQVKLVSVVHSKLH